MSDLTVKKYPKHPKVVSAFEILTGGENKFLNTIAGY